MYPLSKAIFDNTVFNYIVRIQSIDLSNVIRSLVSEVFVPQTIVAEMEDWIQDPIFAARIGYFTNQIRNNQFFKFCTSYNSIIFEEAQNYIDKGEADAIAQSDRINVLLFITDDIRCQKYIIEYYPNIRIHSTYFLIALAYFQGLLPVAESVLAEFHQIMQVKKMKSTTKRIYKEMLRREATEALKVLGFAVDKKQISFLTSLKNYV
jgi:predicted nucleic acid-binding protein